jgi:hypothetical protein
MAFSMVPVAAFAEHDNEGFAFKCRFLTDVKGSLVCTARGFVCKKDPDRGRDCDSAMQVVCGNEVVYQDGVRASFGREKIVLEGKDDLEAGSAPLIIIKKPDGLPELSSAVLRLKDAEGRGFCELKRDMPL